jgi:hypothetical protein
MVDLDPASVNKAFQERRTGGKGGSEPFQPVTELAAQRIRPQDIGPDTEKTLFQEVGDPVKTLDQEVERLRKSLPQDIAKAAEEAAAGARDDSALRKLADRVLLPLARNAFQVDALDRKIRTTKGAALKDLVTKGAERWMLAQILGPLEEQRPLQSKNKVLDALGDMDNAKALDEAKDLLDKRIDATLSDRTDADLFGEEAGARKRTSMDRREAVAFLLYTVSQVKKPDGQPLYPNGVRRAEIVVGLNEFAHAADSYAAAVRQIQERLTRANAVVLGGYVFSDAGKLEVLPEFAQKYPQEIKNVQDLRALVKDRETRLRELQAQLKQHQAQLADRQQHSDEVHKRLLAARAETAKLVAELQRLQQQFFEATSRLANAAEQNAQKEQEIRKLERQQRGQGK